MSDVKPELEIVLPTSQPTVRLTESLEDFQSDEQRLVLDTVAQIRKCGLEAVLPLPQIAVCGNQSSGKSSVLEALTEVPFPRNDNLCTRFATEITLRRAAVDSLRLSIIPDEIRSTAEKASISGFSETIADFSELPTIISKTASVMGIQSIADDAPAISTTRAFAKDVLSFVIEGPNRPQLTVVDVPGLIQNATKGVSEQDKEMVAEITDFYIKQRRTICLAVIQATDDYANQPILTKVREVDSDGNRTLGIITKPDRLSAGSGTEEAFIALARNEDVFFKLGWHVVKNRKFEESHFTIEERNDSEARFFRTSNFQILPADCCGIESLRVRLSSLLFDHVKRELPNLRQDLDDALAETDAQLGKLGASRASAIECRNYLTSLSLQCLKITKAAADGHYENAYFQNQPESTFDVDSPASVRRFRAAIQLVNRKFAEEIRRKGPKYFISTNARPLDAYQPSSSDGLPARLSHEEALKWVSRVLVRSRGKEPVGNYNPLIIGELFWELSSKWEHFAADHVDQVSEICTMFTNTLLEAACPRDVRTRLTELKIKKSLQKRRERAIEELRRVLEDKRDFPATYNHYYTDNIQKARTQRMQNDLTKSIEVATRHERMPGCNSGHTSASVDVAAAIDHFQGQVDLDMQRYSCEEALDCLLSMYKEQRKTFVANVTAQVIERHMVRGLDKIFSPLDINNLSDEDILKVTSEPASVRRKRDFLTDRQQKLRSGKEIFRDIMGRIK
ncbi:hypothetical protein LTR35_017791 [Friedmanniomyces endolithicus]|nr:hypothetical protein LTR35_017791 [Friedmanniomyces endolithicus]KAK0268149.1 hypothetical protein LTS00_017639 [Friedmanniomyces endolithicus]KAK0970498.1 hypothetical protein LTR54_017943 [Friedmanniomyces endolithicus]